MIYPKQMNTVECCSIKMIKIFVFDWKSLIKINNYLDFSSNTKKSFKIDPEMTKNIILPYSTFKKVFDFV